MSQYHQTRHSSLSLTAKSRHARLLFPTEIHKRYCPGHKRTAFIVSAFERDALICVLQCLSTYIRRTPLLNTEVEKSPLFIFFIKPHRPVSSSSLAHWLKAVLSTAGITGSSAHSTWGAGTSKAAYCGLSVQNILELADWSCETTTSLRTLSRYFECAHIFRCCTVISFCILGSQLIPCGFWIVITVFSQSHWVYFRTVVK